MLNLIMKNAQKQYFWWIGNRTALNKRALMHFYPKTHSDNASGGFWTETKPQAKMRSVVSHSPSYSPIFLLTLKVHHSSSTASNTWLSQPTTSTAAALLSGQKRFAGHRWCCLSTPISKHYLGKLLQLWVEKKCGSILQVGFLYPIFQSFYCTSKCEMCAEFSGRGWAHILSVSAMCSTIEPLWYSQENLFMDLDFEHSFTLCHLLPLSLNQCDNEITKGHISS